MLGTENSIIIDVPEVDSAARQKTLIHHPSPAQRHRPADSPPEGTGGIRRATSLSTVT